MQTISRRTTSSILSMSLLTVMAGAAVAPALGEVKQHFASSSALLIQLIVSLPALFIILTSLCFVAVSQRYNTRQIAITGLLLYVVAGTGCFLADDLGLLLVLRALLGVSVGLIMPLSTGLLAYYFTREQQAGMMGLSAAMNQLGGVVATLLAGLLAEIAWNYAFLVYLLGLIALVMVARWLPKEHLGTQTAHHRRVVDWGSVRRFHSSITGMLLLMIIFFIFPTNFAVIAMGRSGMDTTAVTFVMVALDLVAFGAGIVFGWAMRRYISAIRYMIPVGFLLGYLLFCVGTDTATILIASALVGIANGLGVPYLNTVAAMMAGRDATTTVMPLLSAALYLGQFLSPVIVAPLASRLFAADDLAAPYKVGVAICVLFLLQMWITRKSVRRVAD